MSRIANRKEKDRKKRKRLRERLEAAGVPEDQIDRIIELRRQEDYDRRHGYLDDAYRYDPDNDQGYYPDDSGYQPTQGDPLLRGAARAQGMTAKVAKRRHTITRYQHDRATAKGDA